MRANNLIGQRFGTLTVIEKAESSGVTKWICQCDCGNVKTVFGANLMSGRTTSCGCTKTKHGDSKTDLYNRYNQAKRLGMCEEWAKDYQAFKDWVTVNGYEDGCKIVRIDKDKPLSSENCKIYVKDKY